MSTSFIEIGERLRRLRNAAGQTQQEFAETLQTSLRSYKGYEKGQRELPTSIILRLCEISSVSPSWLLTGQRDAMDAEALNAVKKSLHTGLEQLREHASDRSDEAWADYLVLLVKLSVSQGQQIGPDDAQAILRVGAQK